MQQHLECRVTCAASPHFLQVPAPSSWADGMAPEKVMQALEDLQQNNPNTDAEAMRFAISVSELQPDTGETHWHVACHPLWQLVQ